MLFHPLHPEVPNTIPDSFSTALRCDAGDDDDDASLSCHLTDLDRDDNRVTLAQAGGCGLVPIPLPIVFCHDAWQRPRPKAFILWWRQWRIPLGQKHERSTGSTPLHVPNHCEGAWEILPRLGAVMAAVSAILRGG